MKSVTIVTRGSKLALTQTQMAANALLEKCPDVEIEIKTISTKGDQNPDIPLWKIEGVGFFTSQLEQALQAYEGDLAIHSFKDLPTQQADGLCIAAVFRRGYPEDAFLYKDRIQSLDQVPPGAVIGTSSNRRAAMLKNLRADLEIKPIRGNVETRLKKMDSAEYDGMILARAGLERLGLANRICFCFDPYEFIPAPAQGALAIQARADDADSIALVRKIHDEHTAGCVRAERRILTGLHPGCYAPVGVYATQSNGNLQIVGFVADPSGQPFIRHQISGLTGQADQLADELTEQLKKDGAEEIIREAEQQ